jgi:CheY-like chemotaxis protein
MHNRPDVIFMDHLMPGMDGFQAVHAIKGNPQTAAIPILMYTSQEGELYIGQARALGAEGVVSKNLAPADVRTVLQQLAFVTQPEAPALSPSEAAATPFSSLVAAGAIAAQAPVIAGPAVDALLRDEVAALRQHLAEALEVQSQQLAREVRSAMQTAVQAAIPVPPVLPIAPPTEPERPRHSPLPWFLALAASVAAAVLGTLLWQGQQQQEALRSELMDSKSTVALLTARLVPAPQPDVTAQFADPVLVLKVPFGEAPLAGTRVEALREFVARVASLAQKGTVEVRRYTGRFCLAGSGATGYALADGATPASNCDLVAEATDPALGNAVPESAAFTSALAELRRQNAAMLTIDIGSVRGDAADGSYPQIGATTAKAPTAGEWNAVAESNNRVEIRWHPAT